MSHFISVTILSIMLGLFMLLMLAKGMQGALRSEDFIELCILAIGIYLAIVTPILAHAIAVKKRDV